MKEIGKELREYAGKKAYVVCLLLTMVLSYATLLHNPTVGIDDTSFDIYYEDGVSPAMGRWCLFLINKVFPLNYNPYFVEAAGLLMFCVSVTLWVLVLRRLLQDEVSEWVYTAFACVMLSSPIISEVVVWYVQDGIYLGYGATALAVLFTMEAMERDEKRKVHGKALCVAGFFLTVALGFYESFMIVYLVAVLMVFFLVHLRANRAYQDKATTWIACLVPMCVCALVLRSLLVKGMIVWFHLEEQTQVLNSRGLHEVLGWFDETRTLNDFVYVMKSFLVKYYINAVVYVSIIIFVLSIGVIVCLAIVWSVRKRDAWIGVAALGMLLVPWILPVLQGVATYYRSSQYIPLVTGFSVLLLGWQLQRCKAYKWYGILRTLSVFLVLVLLYRQAYEMNKWLYVDAMKYENDKAVMESVALHILENCDAGKPICVIGDYQTPMGLQKAAYCPEWSRKYRLVQRLVNIVDKDLFEEYNTPQGYAFAETPRLSFIDWGSTAFYGFDRELIKFWKMHGYEFTEDGNLAHYEEARQLMENGPVWPMEGSIVELDEYIIVNFGEKSDGIK